MGPYENEKFLYSKENQQNTKAVYRMGENLSLLATLKQENEYLEVTMNCKN